MKPDEGCSGLQLVTVAMTSTITRFCRCYYILTSTHTHSFSYSSQVSYTLLVVYKVEQERQWKYNVTLRHIRATTAAVEKKQVLHILSVSLQPQVTSMQCACLILSSVACPALPYYSTLSIRFSQNLIEHKMCVLIFSATFVRNISHSKKK